MQEHLDSIKEKPQHVRENIAIAISGGITLLVFLGWAGTLASSHTFAISNPITPTPEVADQLAKAGETKDSFSNLLGAAGTAGSSASSGPAITVVDSPSPEPSIPANQTVIHF